MIKPTKPFRSIDNQRVLSLVVLMASIFLIFYTPSIFSFGKFTSNIFGALFFIISAFYLLKTLNLG